MIDIARPPTGPRTAQAARLLEIALNRFAIFFAVIIALISLGYAFLAYPQTDDLERTGALRFLSPLTRIVSDYVSIDGRWASKWIEYSCYRGGHVIGFYPVMLMVLLVIGIIGCCCGVAMISGRRVSEPSVIASGIVFYSFLWLSVPRGEIFYWFPAGTEYLLPLSLGMILLWLFYNFSGWWSKTLVLAMSFLLPALHEVFGSWIVGVLGVTWLVRLGRGRPGGGIAGMAALAGTLGTASVVLSPGIRARAASSPHQPLHDAFTQALHIERFIFAHWAATLPLLVVILLAAAHMRHRPSWYEDAPLLVKSCLLAAMVPLPLLMLTMISYGLGGGIPARVYDGFYILFAAVVGSFAAVCGFDLGRWDAAKVFIDAPWGALLRSAAICLALAGAMSLTRFHAAFHDIDPAIRNRAVWEQRNAEIWSERNAGVRDVVVSQHMLPLDMLPVYFDMTENTNFYANQHLKTYYNVDNIRLSVSSPATGSADAKIFDHTLSQPLDSLPETVAAHCDVGLDSINGISPATPPSVISNRLTVVGWTAVSGKDGIVADEVLLTLSNGKQKLYLGTRTEPRPDVKKFFVHPEMPEPGFMADIDVSKLKGGYRLSLSTMYRGKLESCPQLDIPLHFNE